MGNLWSFLVDRATQGCMGRDAQLIHPCTSMVGMGGSTGGSGEYDAEFWESACALAETQPEPEYC